MPNPYPKVTPGPYRTMFDKDVTEGSGEGSSVCGQILAVR